MDDTFYDIFQDDLEKTLAAMRREFGRVRTGRASATLFDGVTVDYYGTQTPLNQIATIAVPEPRLVTIQAYDRSAIAGIEKSILKADLGLMPANDGKLIRVPIPELSGERRKELVKQVRKTAEEFRVSVRNHRRAAIDGLKEMQKGKEITEDEVKQGQERIQKITAEFVVKVDGFLKAKEEEIMEV
ncbi:MAG: ribosome recycling factor [Deltaproteobacteria bacterium]|nr:ribosome recycling factor [Deltaproteobacteria bacterium]